MKRQDMRVPTAYGFMIGECENPCCEAVHVELYRRDGRPLARAALTMEHLETLAAAAGYSLRREVQA